MLKKIWRPTIIAILLALNTLNVTTNVALAQKASEASIDEDDLNTVQGLSWAASGFPFSKVTDVKDTLAGTVIGKIVIDRHGVDHSYGSGIISAPFDGPDADKLIYVSLWGSKIEGCYAEFLIQYSTVAGKGDEEVSRAIVPKKLQIGVNGQIIELEPQPGTQPRRFKRDYTYYIYRDNVKYIGRGTWYAARNLFAINSNVASLLGNAPQGKVKVRITLSNDETVVYSIGEKTVARWKYAYGFNPYCMPANKVQPSASQTQSDDEDEDEDTTSTQVSSASQHQPASSPAAPVRQASASGNKPSAGEVALAATQTLGNVDVNLDGAYVNTSGRFIANLTIQNRSDRNFGFVPLFAKVQDANGQDVPARVSVDTNAVVSPGKSMKAQVYVLGKRWNNTGSQNLILVIKEGSTGGRTFRVPF